MSEFVTRSDLDRVEAGLRRDMRLWLCIGVSVGQIATAAIIRLVPEGPARVVSVLVRAFTNS